jgi:hypothetical protein
MKAAGEARIQYVSEQMPVFSTWKTYRLHIDTS